MTTANRCLGVLIGCLLGAAAVGCGGNNERLKAFLQEPRSPVSASEYRVLPPDVILINSIHVSDINNFKVEVRPDGKINLPLLGEVTVAGNTPAEIEAVLMAKSREFYEEVGPLRDRYDKILRGWEVPLNRFAGQNGCFALRVEAGETPIQDWAVWVEAKIIRP